MCFNLFMSVVFRGIIGGIIVTIISVTGWGVVGALVNIILSIKCSLDPNIKDRKSILALTHLSFEFCASINLLVTIVYWSVLHGPAME